jgi:hypothetical protein
LEGSFLERVGKIRKYREQQQQKRKKEDNLEQNISALPTHELLLQPASFLSRNLISKRL